LEAESVRDSGETAESELNLGEIEGDEAVAAGGGEARGWW
jgi:hypothetical protein